MERSGGVEGWENEVGDVEMDANEPGERGHQRCEAVARQGERRSQQALDVELSACPVAVSLQKVNILTNRELYQRTLGPWPPGGRVLVGGLGFAQGSPVSATSDSSLPPINNTHRDLGLFQHPDTKQTPVKPPGRRHAQTLNIRRAAVPWIITPLVHWLPQVSSSAMFVTD